MVACYPAGGFAFGYGVSRLAGLPEKAARTNSIEVTSLSMLSFCIQQLFVVLIFIMSCHSEISSTTGCHPKYFIAQSGLAQLGCSLHVTVAQ